jgi:hypothetical protein
MYIYYYYYFIFLLLFETLSLGYSMIQACIKKGPGIHPGPFKINNVFLTTARIDIATARIDIATAGINITATRINDMAAARINDIATGFRDFSIRTFGMF